MSDDLDVLERLEAELAPTVEHARFQGSIFHYTNAAGFQGIVQSRQIWATHYRHLNDSAELSIGESEVQATATALAADSSLSEPKRWLLKNFCALHETDSLSKVADIFVASFSGAKNDLSQWRAYGTDGSGYCLGFSNFPLPTSDAPDAQLVLWLVECEYDVAAFRAKARSTLLALAQAFEREATTSGNLESFEAIGAKVISLMLRHVGALVPRLKHEAFRGEREWRLIATPMRGFENSLISYRPSHFGLVPYIAIDLAEDGQLLALTHVIVGPTLDPEAGCSSAKAFLRKFGYPDDSIVLSSKIPYRRRT
jgi:hypothetical protein